MVDVSMIFLNENTLLLLQWGLRARISSLRIQSITNKLHKISAIALCLCLCRVFVLICFAVTHFNESVNINTVMVLSSVFPFSCAYLCSNFCSPGFGDAHIFLRVHMCSAESLLNPHSTQRLMCDRFVWWFSSSLSSSSPSTIGVSLQANPLNIHTYTLTHTLYEVII